MKSMLDPNRRLLHDFLLQRDDLDCFWPEYGTVIFPRLKNGDADSLCQLLRHNFETSVVPGQFFEDPLRFRVGVGLSTASVVEALPQLAAGLDRYRKTLRRST
jgi:aspartate/methionine/tyrosine aminotransferase